MSGMMVGLDVGTTKICVVVAMASGTGMEVVALGTSASNGLRKGVVVDMDATVHSIRKAVSEAEVNSGLELKSAYVGLSGGHVKCVESYGATGIKGKEVGRDDLDRVIESASAVYVPLDREIMHVIPAEFIIDSQDGIVRPIGMSGVRLEVKVNIITASQAAIENLLRCCERAGLRVSGMVLEPLASAMSVLTSEEIQGGAVLIDIGGATADMALFKDGTLRHAAVVPIGGDHFTNDMSIGMRLPVREAERLKRLYGSARAGGGGNAEALSMNGERRQIQWAQVTEIVRPRADELFSLLKKELAPVSHRHLPSCAVLTGGASLLKGMSRTAEAHLGLPVRVGSPERARSELIKDIAKSPEYATGVGLVIYGYEREGGLNNGADLFASTIRGINRWAKSVFSLQGWALGFKRLATRVRNTEQ